QGLEPTHAQFFLFSNISVKSAVSAVSLLAVLGSDCTFLKIFLDWSVTDGRGGKMENKDIICQIPYNDLTVCLETASHLVNCYYPNPDIQDFFLYIHSKYFHNCTKKEFLLEDAPHGLVITLTLIPVSLIPMLVYLVIWKSKIQE
uniref:Si:ch73-334d15.2 n=1 Tax=Mastacembelus armatus TaxID=205130 RepID=A0A7N8XDQ6_9TELE